MQQRSVLLLALVGVLLASLLTAALLQALRPSWPFNACWLVGTLLSATDPVAVVALLKDLGADKALSTLLEGESLVNDGSAIVLFSLLFNWIAHTNGPELPAEAQEHYPGVGLDLLRILAQMLCLGVLFGGLAGWALTLMLKRVYNDKLVEISLVVASSYLVFWLAELVMASSAVLATVVMGLVVNMRRSAISPEVLEFLHEFYEVCSP